MGDFLDEGTVRLAAFLGILAAVALAELAFPRLPGVRRRQRWPVNLGIVVLDTLLARLLLPGITVAAAVWAQGQGVGLFHMIDIPFAAAVAVSVVLLDLAIYAQHVIFHKVPVLWRLHRVHHTDLAFDVTTGVRFHPVEILLSLVIKAVLVVALGAPAFAIVLFEIILSSTSLFNHGNLRLPTWLDRAIRTVIVTPDMHRVHHSAIPTETDSNFGFNLSVWDRLFRTYRAQPEKGHEAMTIGLGDFRDIRQLGLWGLLKQPFQATPKN